MPTHDSTTTTAQINALEVTSTPSRGFLHSYTTRLPFIGHVAQPTTPS
jgi:hypothetical protein